MDVSFVNSLGLKRSSRSIMFTGCSGLLSFKFLIERFYFGRSIRILIKKGSKLIVPMIIRF